VKYSGTAAGVAVPAIVLGSADDGAVANVFSGPHYRVARVVPSRRAIHWYITVGDNDHTNMMVVRHDSHVPRSFEGAMAV